MATLPVGYRPSAIVSNRCQGSGNNTHYVSVYPDGSIYSDRYTAGTVPLGSWLKLISAFLLGMFKGVITMDFEKFLDEFYLSQKNGTLSDYTKLYWDDVLHLFGDSPVIFDILIEQIINGKESQFNDSKNNLIEIYNTTKDFSQYVFNETNPEFEELKRKMNRYDKN